MANLVEGKDKPSVAEGPKSIVVVELPDELANREILQNHFSQYGNIERMTCSLRHHYAIIHFTTAEEATKARKNGKEIDPRFGPLKVYMSNKVPPGGPIPIPLKRKPSLTSLSTKTPTSSSLKLRRKVSSSRMSSSDDPESSSSSSSSTVKRTISNINNESPFRPLKKVGVLSGAKKNPFASPSIAAVNSLKQALQKAQSAKSIPSTSLTRIQSETKKIIPAPPPPSQVFIERERTVQANETQKKTYDLLTFNADTSEAQKLFGKKYTTAEDRYRALEARDKLLRARIPKGKISVELATRLFGTCGDMCPEKERYMRQYQRQLTSFETVDGPEYTVDHRKAIKVYSRSSADQEEPLPHELRPASTLDLTLNYLLKYIVPLANVNEEILGDWYNFLWDRTRSIRKDITQQQLTNLQAVGLMEKCARFHIHCSSRLCELELHSFDPKLNDENLMKCLQSLEHLYDDLRKRKIKCPNEPEFRAYQIMMNLNEGDILCEVQQRPKWILQSEEVNLALRLHHAVFQKNFVAFFRMVANSPYMVSCILHRYFFQVRTTALHSLSKASKLDAHIGLSTVQRMLGYENALEEFKFLCQSHRLTCDVTNDRLIMNRSKLTQPEAPIISREAYLIESKLHISVEEAINGEALGQDPLETYMPHSSFDTEGYLIPGSVAGSNSPYVPPPPPVIVPLPSQQVLNCSVDSTDSRNSAKFSFREIATATKEKTSVAPPPPPPPFSFTSPPSIFGTPGADNSSVFGRSSFVNNPSVFSQTQPSSKRMQSAFQIGTFQSNYSAGDFQKEQKKRALEDFLSTAAERLIEKIVSEEIGNLSNEAVRLSENAKMIRVQRQNEGQVRECLIEVTAQRVNEQAVRDSVKEIAQKQIDRFRLANRVCELILDEELDKAIDILVPNMVKGALWIAQKQEEKTIEKATPIFRRIKLRMIIHKWLLNAQRKRVQRTVREEKHLKTMWDFPVINPMRKSNSEVLKTLRGTGNQSRSPNIAKADKSTTAWIHVYETIRSMTQKCSEKMQSIVDKFNNSSSEQVLDSPERNLSPRRRTFTPEYQNHCWKRRWPEAPEEEEDDESDNHHEPSRGVKSPRISMNGSNGFGKVEIKQETEEDKLLADIQRFIEETKEEKNRVFDISA